MLILLIVVAIQALISSLLIFFNKKFKDEDFYLTLFLGNFFFHLLYKIFLTLFFNDENIFEKLHGSFSFFYAPLFYLYLLKVLGISITQKKILMHVSPFLISSVINVVLVFISISDLITLKIIDIYNWATLLFLFPSFLGYSIYALKKIKENENIKDKIINLKLKIVKVISYYFIILSALTLIGLCCILFGITNPINMRYVFYFSLLIIFFFVIHTRFSIFFESQKIVIQELKQEIKYKNSLLNENELDDILGNIQTYFNKKSAYLDSEFTLEQLSDEMKIPKVKITQALNIRLNTNFYKYLNSLRVEEAKKRLETAVKPNFSEIGYESGFKNKSTFYKYFKQIEGITPSEYKSGLIV